MFSYFLKCIPPTHINDDDNLQFVFFLNNSDQDKDENVFWLLSGG